MRLVTFLDHPLGETDGNDAITRADNISNFYDWMKFFAAISGLVLEVSWVSYAIAGIGGPRHFVDALKMIEHCDLYIACGGVHTPHMRNNIKTARRLGVPIVDMTRYGVTPPEVDENLALSITSLIRSTVDKSTRRFAAMPLLTPANIDELVKLRHAVDTYMPTENAGGVAVLDRILEAASEHER